MPTTNAVPSADPSDLLFNAQKLDEVVNGAADFIVDRKGVQRLTLTGALRLIGFEAPVAFTTGLAMTRATQTVTNGGNTYHADPASLPFTTTGTFNGAQWRLVSNVTQADLTAYAVPLVGGAGTIEMAKLTSAVQALINGALQKSGGTMTGPVVLAGNATAPLQAVPKQQHDAAIRPDLSSLSVTVLGNAMTCALPAETINFRSATLNDGSVFARPYAGGSLIVPSGATLGTTNGAPARIVWGLIDNAGTPEPFVINAGGTANLDETALISTTAISSGANNPNVFYSQTARSNVAFRIRGWCDITQAAAGTWATAPTKVTGASIQTLKPIQGRGRTPQNMLAFRTFGVTYYNTTGAEIFAHVNLLWTSGVGAARLTVDGINFDGPVFGGANETSPVSAPVPPGSGYTLSGTNSIGFAIIGWNESRQG